MQCLRTGGCLVWLWCASWLVAAADPPRTVPASVKADQAPTFIRFVAEGARAGQVQTAVRLYRNAAGAEVTAVDISPARMARVGENLARTGLRAELVTADALAFEGGPYDAVLLDAPCSATGTIRRHPDLPHAKDGGDFPGLFDLQAHLIDRALGMLKPGGRLVFCTCSLLFDEGEEQVRDACARHPGLIVDREALKQPGIAPDWISAEGGLRLRPDFWAEQGGMDGFYIACLRHGG